MNIKYNKEDVVSHHGVAAVIKNQKGDILIQEHTKYGFWTIPVGKVKEGQDVIDGLREEILEECNLKVEEQKELMVKDYYYNREGKEITVTSHLYEIIKFSGEMKNLEPLKHKQQLFMPIEEIKRLPYLSDMTLLYLEQLNFIRESRLS